MTKRRRAPRSSPDELRERANALKLYGLVANWDEYAEQPWLPRLLEHEEEERQVRSLARRVRNAKLGRFKELASFDWSWPRRIDRELLEEVFTLGFLEEAANVILVGPNGVGKTTLVKNLAHKALLRGYTAR
ncbi:MAG: AAA family ATPase, partial [Alphaproteobacteria bacterium]